MSKCAFYLLDFHPAWIPVVFHYTDSFHVGFCSAFRFVPTSYHARLVLQIRLWISKRSNRNLMLIFHSVIIFVMFTVELKTKLVDWKCLWSVLGKMLTLRLPMIFESSYELTIWKLLAVWESYTPLFINFG